MAVSLGFEPRKCPTGNGDDRSLIERQLLAERHACVKTKSRHAVKRDG